MNDTPVIVQQQPLPEKQPPPIVMIGAGGIVRDAHLPAYSKAGFEVVEIYNRELEPARALADLHGIEKVSTDIDETIEQAPSDAVFDVALMPAQFGWVLDKIPKGRAVLIQKPLGDSLDEARALRDICHRRQLVAAVNVQMRFAPYVRAARSLIDAGVLGELVDLEIRVVADTPWQMFPNVVDHPRLEIAQHSVHYIDLVRSFLGNPDGVHAVTLGHPHKTMSSTRSTIVLTYGDSVRATIHTNHDHDFGRKHQEAFVKWEGTEGAAVATIGLMLNYPHGGSDGFEYIRRGGTWTDVAVEGSWFPDAFIGSMSTLMRFVEGSTDSLETSVDDIVETMAVVEAAYESNESAVFPDLRQATGSVHRS